MSTTARRRPAPRGRRRTDAHRQGGVSTDRVLIGIGLIVILAVGCQVLATRLRVPVVILLLLTGFCAGALPIDVEPGPIFGHALPALVSAGVAVILYDACL